VDSNSPYDWEAATGVPELHPPANSSLAARLGQSAKPIPDCTLRRALGILAVAQEIPVELRIEKEDLTAREYLDGWLDLTAGSFSMSEEQAVAVKYSNEPSPSEPLTLRQVLSIILDQANLHCHEEE